VKPRVRRTLLSRSIASEGEYSLKSL
jgi:hypothetical protein